MNKKVSVIIPNYNYARFLQRRIDCIVNQTIKPAEIIFLDDCSTDNSLEVAQEILSKIDVPYRIIPNTVNQGVFKQWLKGIELTQHDYFWIAEADDYCELNFLETLLPAFDDPNVVMSYCKSKFINEHGQDVYNETLFKNDLFKTERWDSDFVECGNFEITNYYSAINVSPNASAILINKNLINSSMIYKYIKQYKKVGDWMFYILVLNSFVNNKVFYSCQMLNYHYRHEQSTWISSNDKKEPYIFNESLMIYIHCIENGLVSDYAIQTSLRFITNWFCWYNIDNQTKLLLNYLVKLIPENSLFNLLHAALQTNLQQIKSLENTVSSLNQELSVIKQDADLLRQINQDITHELSLIKNSRAWRLVSLYRNIKQKILKLNLF